MNCFILDPNKRPIPVTHTEWAQWRSDRSLWVVAHDTINGTTVHTGFLGLESRRAARHPPQLFESLIVPADGKPELERYDTWEEALQGHKALVAELRAEA